MKTLNLTHYLHLSPELSREDAADLTDRLMEELVDLGVDDPATSLDYGERLITIELSLSSDVLTEKVMAAAARNLVSQARFAAGIPVKGDVPAPSPAPAVTSADDTWELLAS